MRGISVAPLAERIEALSIPEPNSGCLLWLGVIKRNGYGTLGVKVGAGWHTHHAHRVAYEIAKGQVPAGLDLDHKCRNRACVNPDHLEPVTRSENLLRRPRVARPPRLNCRAGHPYSGVNSRNQKVCHICLAAATRRYRERKP